jgi:DNA-binding response OmpR family regulator
MLAEPEADCRLLLVEPSPATAMSFSWLELNVPGIQVDRASLARALSQAQAGHYDLIFIDIPEDATPIEWLLIGNLVRRQQGLDPAPVLVPLVPSGTVLQSMRRSLSEISPVYLTRPLNLRELRQVVLAYARQTH